MQCRSYARALEDYRHEQAFWSGSGVIHDINFSIFDYPEPLCLLFTGFNGDMLWDRDGADSSEPLFRGGSGTGQGLGEFRLLKGIFHCPPAFWAARHVKSIHAIGVAPELEKWALHNDYDRPICRRILEEAGVPGDIFGHKKGATSFNERTYPWPLSRSCAQAYRNYLNERNVFCPPAWPFLIAHYADHYFLRILREKLAILPNLNSKFTTRANSMLFQWATFEMARSLRDAMGVMSNGRAEQ